MSIGQTDAECVRLCLNGHPEVFGDLVQRYQVRLVTVYLLPKQLELLVPQLRKLDTGARIVSHQFEIPGIKADTVIELTSAEDGDVHTIYLWTAPLPTEE